MKHTHVESSLIFHWVQATRGHSIWT